MFCVNCGTKHQPAAKFCTGCGTPVPSAAGVVAQPAQVPITHLTEVAEQQSVDALKASVPVVATTEAPVLAGVGADEAPASPAAAPRPPAASASPAYAPHQPGFASPVPQYAPPTTSLPPVPTVHPSVATPPYAPAPAAPAAANQMPDFVGMARGMVAGADGEVDKAKVMKVGIAAGAVVIGIIMLSVVVKFFQHPSFGGFVGLVFMGLCLTLVVIGVIAVRAHQQETREARTLGSLPPSVQHVVAQMEPGAQAAFFNEYERYKKKIVVSYLLLWFCGAHYFYLRQPLLNVCYWFTGAGGWFWYWFDVFRMPSLVRAANEQTARQALQTLHIGATFAQMPQAPAAMVQPVPPAPTAQPGPQDR